MATTSNKCSLSTIFLDEPPSCLQFCPTAEDFLVIGTYLLDIDKSDANVTSPASSRSGSLQLFQINPQSYTLSQVQRIALPHAVFDLQFSTHDPSLFAVALSAGKVSLYRIENGPEGKESPVSINFLDTLTVRDDDTKLALYLTWIPPSFSEEENTRPGFAVSFSDGQISVFRSNESSRLLQQAAMDEIRLEGIPIEVWCLAFHRRDGQISLFSGDDFNQLREFAIDNEFETGSLALNDRGKVHEGGVTAILPLCNVEEGSIILTGSYDQRVRVYQIGIRRRVLAEMDLGGGVWRLKVINPNGKIACQSPPSQENDAAKSYIILASCMHGGVRVIRVASSGPPGGITWNIELLAQFTEHESMNYASDVWTNRKQIETTVGSKGPDILCVSSSFYDKRVCVWQPEL